MSCTQTKTPKSVLYELLMINMCPYTHVFATSKIGGFAHRPIYGSTVTIIGWRVGVSNTIPTCAGRGEGSSKKAAEHAAAVQVLLELKKANGLSWPNIYVTPKSRNYPLLYSLFPQPEQQNNLLLIEAGPTANPSADYYSNNRMARNPDVY